MSKITPEIVAEHGLTAEEYDRIKTALGREPNLTELGIFSVMWSEHCSYKSSRVWLKTLPTTGPKVVHGPGENAGVVDIGDGDVVVFKMESHNHPSFIEPYQGAATGIGGILRDVFTMGARPVALMNTLRFGVPEHPKTRHLVSGVVSGIAGYGNCMGVPTVGGEVNFDASYNGNILVNAMCVGLARADKLFLSAAKGVGNPVVYVGSKTGRDGIHGATMASAEFGEGKEERRPTVQVGDPFTEKLLLEACLELMASDAIIAIQDMGAAGLTSSSVEMAAKGGVGIELDLDAVPTREEGMSAYEMMLSESQERMLMVLKPGSEERARAIFRKWELDAAVIGRTTDTGRLVLKHAGAIVADLPLKALADEAPLYQRLHQAPDSPALLPEGEYAPPEDLKSALLMLIGSPDLSSRRWVWEQYDHMVMADTAQGPGGDAAVIRVHGTTKALAITTDVTPRYCAADPFEGGKQAVAEAWRNLTAVGAEPLAITDNLNFGNPEKPAIMGQLVEAIRGIAEAARALSFPVVSGNVSLYNETDGRAIHPTPAVGGVGLLRDLSKMARHRLKSDGSVLLLMGETKGHLGRSIYLRDVLGRIQGSPPPVDLSAEKRNGDFVRGLISEDAVRSIHDLSDGGLLVAVAEMAMAGRRGVKLELKGLPCPLIAFLFGEDQARYVIEVAAASADEIRRRAREVGVPCRAIGTVGGDALVIDAPEYLGAEGKVQISVSVLTAAHDGWFPKFMNG